MQFITLKNGLLLLLFVFLFQPSSFAQTDAEKEKLDGFADAFVELYNQQKFQVLIDSLTPADKNYQALVPQIKGIYTQLGAIKDLKEPTYAGKMKARYVAELDAMDLWFIITTDEKQDKLVSFLLTGIEETVKFPEINNDCTIDALAKAFMESEQSVGLSIGIIQNGKKATYHYGGTSQEGATPTDASIYEIGSITKTFTTTILSQMIQEGKLKLEDPVNNFLPDSLPPLKYKEEVLTIKHLANHTSTFPSEPPNFATKTTIPHDPFSHYTPDRIMDFLSTYTFESAPGETASYSNFGMGLLGYILKNLDPQSYQQIVSDYITIPLNMPHTFVRLPAWEYRNATIGHNQALEQAPMWEWGGNTTLLGAGAVKSTIPDMLNYLEANIEQDEKTAFGKAAKFAQTASAIPYAGNKVALGWLHLPFEEHTITWHNGGTSGYRSFTGFITKEGIGVIILTNSSIDATDQLGQLILALLLQKDVL